MNVFVSNVIKAPDLKKTLTAITQEITKIKATFFDLWYFRLEKSRYIISGRKCNRRCEETSEWFY